MLRFIPTEKKYDQFCSGFSNTNIFEGIHVNQLSISQDLNQSLALRGNGESFIASPFSLFERSYIPLDKKVA